MNEEEDLILIHVLRSRIFFLKKKKQAPLLKTFSSWERNHSWNILTPELTITNWVSYSVYVKNTEFSSWRNLSVVKLIVKAKPVIYRLHHANTPLLDTIAVYSMYHTRKQKVYLKPKDYIREITFELSTL